MPQDDYFPQEYNAQIDFGENWKIQLPLLAIPLTIPVATINSNTVLVDALTAANNDKISTQAADEAATQALKAASANYETFVRNNAGVYQANPVTTDAQRAQLGITVRDKTRTPTPAPTTRPIADIGLDEPARHIIHFFDEGTPNRKAKPDGVIGCEIHMFIGPNAPPSFDDYKYVATDSQTPYIVEFQPSDVGKKVHYILRWTTRRGQTGPWSLVYSATVAG